MGREKAERELGEARQARWIPVSEKLPDSWAIVVCDGFVQRTAARFDGDVWEWVDGAADGAPKEAVSHWMPLPERPK